LDTELELLRSSLTARALDLLREEIPDITLIATGWALLEMILQVLAGTLGELAVEIVLKLVASLLASTIGHQLSPPFTPVS
jgi:hypothetical protein